MKKNLGTKLNAKVRGAAYRPTHHPAEDLNPALPVERPRKRIADNQATHELGAPTSNAQANRSAPVLCHHGEILQTEAIHEVLKHIAVLPRCEAVPRPRFRHAIAGEIERNATEVAL
jgi:hypothetical protein